VEYVPYYQNLDPAEAVKHFYPVLTSIWNRKCAGLLRINPLVVPYAELEEAMKTRDSKTLDRACYYTLTFVCAQSDVEMMQGRQSVRLVMVYMRIGSQTCVRTYVAPLHAYVYVRTHIRTDVACLVV
jgi:hypothetical protein